jgi:hypothetical protein
MGIFLMFLMGMLAFFALAYLCKNYFFKIRGSAEEPEDLNDSDIFARQRN